MTWNFTFSWYVSRFSDPTGGPKFPQKNFGKFVSSLAAGTTTMESYRSSSARSVLSTATVDWLAVIERIGGSEADIVCSEAFAMSWYSWTRAGRRSEISRRYTAYLYERVGIAYQHGCPADYMPALLRHRRGMWYSDTTALRTTSVLSCTCECDLVRGDTTRANLSRDLRFYLRATGKRFEETDNYIARGNVKIGVDSVWNLDARRRESGKGKISNE